MWWFVRSISRRRQSTNLFLHVSNCASIETLWFLEGCFFASEQNNFRAALRIEEINSTLNVIQIIEELFEMIFINGLKDLCIKRF